MHVKQSRLSVPNLDEVRREGFAGDQRTVDLQIHPCRGIVGVQAKRLSEESSRLLQSTAFLEEYPGSVDGAGPHGGHDYRVRGASRGIPDHRIQRRLHLAPEPAHLI